VTHDQFTLVLAVVGALVLAAVVLGVEALVRAFIGKRSR
jgi:hypothetical protein